MARLNAILARYYVKIPFLCESFAFKRNRNSILFFTINVMKKKQIKNEIPEAIFKTIEYYAQSKYWSVSQLCEMATLSSSSVYAIRNEHRLPNLSTICFICEALEITIKEFFDKEDEILNGYSTLASNEDKYKEFTRAMLKEMRRLGLDK